jgi:hypothetical protein
MATRRDSVQQLPVHAELIDVAFARSRHIILFLCVLFGKRNEYIATQNLYAERRKSLGHIWIGEAVHQVKVAAEHIDRTIAEVRRVKEGSVGIRANREAFVYGARLVNGDNRALAVHTWVPARNSAILSREDETRGGGYAAVCNIEAACSVEPGRVAIVTVRLKICPAPS